MAWLPHCFWCERRRIGWWYNARVELHWWRDARQKGLQKWSFRQMCCSRSMVGIKTETFEKTWMEPIVSSKTVSYWKNYTFKTHSAHDYVWFAAVNWVCGATASRPGKWQVSTGWRLQLLSCSWETTPRALTCSAPWKTSLTAMVVYVT